MDHVRVPEVRVYLLKYNGPIKGVTTGFPVLSMASLNADGINVGSSNFLKVFKYEYNDEGDKAQITFIFPTTNLDLTYFKDGVRIALFWGYRGEKQIFRDCTISEVKGKYSRTGYSITVEAVSTAYWMENNENPDVAETLNSVGATMGFEYFNKETNSFIKYNYHTRDGVFDVSGAILDRRPEEPPLIERSEWTPRWETEKGAYRYKEVKPPDPERYKGTVWDKEHRLQTIKDKLTQFLLLAGMQGQVYYRDNEVLNKSGVEDSPAIRVYYEHPNQNKSIISFSFEAGVGATDAETESEVEIYTLDPNTNTINEISIAGTYYLPSEEGTGDWDFEIVKHEGVWKYKQGEKVLGELSKEDQLKYLKLTKESRYQEYMTSIKPEEYDSEGFAKPKGVSPARDQLLELESSQALETVWNDQLHIFEGNMGDRFFLKHYNTGKSRAFPYTEKSMMEYGGAPTDFSFKESDARKFIIQSYTSGSLEEITRRIIDNKIKAIFNNVTCQLTIEGDPFLENHFKFMVYGVGKGASGSYLCNKSSHSIISGKYTTTLFGGRMPDQGIGVTVRETTRNTEGEFNKLIESREIYEKLAIITSVAANQSFASQPDNLVKALKDAGIPIDQVNVEYKRKIGVNVSKSSSNYVADGPDALFDIVGTPGKFQGALDTEIRAIEIMELSNRTYEKKGYTRITSTEKTSIEKVGPIPGQFYFDQPYTTVEPEFFYETRDLITGPEDE